MDRFQPSFRFCSKADFYVHEHPKKRQALHKHPKKEGLRMDRCRDSVQKRTSISNFEFGAAAKGKFRAMGAGGHGVGGLPFAFPHKAHPNLPRATPKNIQKWKGWSFTPISAKFGISFPLYSARLPTNFTEFCPIFRFVNEILPICREATPKSTKNAKDNLVHQFPPNLVSLSHYFLPVCRQIL